MNARLEPDTPLPPPTSGEATAPPTYEPTMPKANLNLVPALAVTRSGTGGVSAGARHGRRKPPMSRTRVYGIGAAIFLVLSIAGYIAFREYIYGDEAPPILDIDGNSGN